MITQASIDPGVGKNPEIARDSAQSLCQHRIRVLVVDDDYAVGEILSLGLGCHGYDVDVARTCREAGQKLASGQYSFVLLDLSLPDSTGIHFYYRLKARWPALARRVAFLTAAAERHPELGLMREEGCPVLLKPSRISEVLAALQELGLES